MMTFSSTICYHTRMKKPNRKHVLVVLEPMSDLRLAGITAYAQEHGWILAIRDRLDDQTPLWRVDGVLATLRQNPATDKLYEGFRQAKVPVVDLATDRLFLRVPRVANDHRAVGQMAARHFAERGFKRTVWFSTGTGLTRDLRAAGLGDGAVAKPVRWIFANAPMRVRRGGWQAFLKWVDARLKEVILPIGVLAHNETDAALLLNACIELGVDVPQDVAILAVGNDFGICERQAVPLSTIEQDMTRGARKAAALLDRLMHGSKQPKRTILLPPIRLIVRKSTDLLAADDPTVRAVLQYIRTHLSEPFGPAQIAQALGLRRGRLDALFTGTMGRPIGAEILRQRIAQAKKLLAETDLPVKAIAADTGFCTASYFVRTFRSAVGITPNRFRKDV